MQKKFGPVWAVRGADLEVSAGEFVSIVGPSGSGKTSLLTMIAGFEAPTSGTVIVGEKNVTALAPHRRNIGMVFQKYALFPHMSVRQNIAFPLKMRRLARGSAAKKRVDAMLELVEMGGMQHRFPHELSGGQQQRVAVARALVFDPPVILMDEPLGALDKKLRETMQFEIKQIQERTRATVIYVTHDQEEALTMSDRVAVMHGGRIEQTGTPDDLYAKPANAFVAGFVGSINFLPGAVCAKGHSHVSINVGGTIVDVPAANVPSSRSLEIGGSVKLAARPEHITIVPPTSGRQQGLFGTIETVIFTGATRKVLFRLKTLPDLTLRADIPSSFDLPERGSDIAVTLQADALMAFATDQGSQA